MSEKPTLDLADVMVERAARSLYEHGMGYDIDADPTARESMMTVARAMLEAAFQGVPLTNYGIGLALQFFDLVICVKDREHSPAAGVYRKNGKPHEFDAVPHYLEVSWQHKPTRFIKRVAVSKLGAPDGAG